jgi:hypothetical protein
MSLVQDVRGGRDNDPNFGSRMRGTGPVAQLIRNRFNIAHRRLGLDTIGRVELNRALFRPPGPAGAPAETRVLTEQDVARGANCSATHVANKLGVALAHTHRLESAIESPQSAIEIPAGPRT